MNCIVGRGRLRRQRNGSRRVGDADEVVQHGVRVASLRGLGLGRRHPAWGGREIDGHDLLRLDEGLQCAENVGTGANGKIWVGSAKTG